VSVKVVPVSGVEVSWVYVPPCTVPRNTLYPTTLPDELLVHVKATE
jgi:hypothetical protein